MAATASTKPKKIRIGDLLIAQKIISQEQLNQALAEQKRSGRKLGRVLIENGHIGEDQLLNLLAQQLQVPYVDLKRYQYKPDIVRMIPEAHARRFRAIALEDTASGLLVGMADPTDIFAYDELVRVLRRSLRLAVVKESELLKAIDRIYRRTEEMTGLAAELEQELSEYDIDITNLSADDVTDAPVVKLLQSIFEDAVQVNASDIHIEPDEHELRIRFRLDGVLRVQMTADRRISGALVSRLKLMAGLDIAEKRLPQDGRCQVRVRDQRIDVRLSTMPVQYGESAVMRLLVQSTGILNLDQIGMTEGILEPFRRMLHAPHGMVLVTGPTGSGKTTTLYAALSELNDAEHKILTVEDPVEYRLRGVNQIQVNTKIDMTFSRVLRSILRQDPDIILIGEMRDNETAEIGMRAALTGHMVLSTLHTNNAIATATRLIDMGIPPYMIAAAVRGIVAQRLVRRVCEGCAEVCDITSNQKAALQELLTDEQISKLKFKRGSGCTHCNSTGYAGRIAIFELLELNEALIDVMHGGDQLAFAKAAASQSSYRPLKQSAITLAAKGITTLDQALRIIYGDI